MIKLFKDQKIGGSCRLLPGMDTEQADRYRHFKGLLDHNRAALTMMADLEQTYYNNQPFTIQSVERMWNLLFIEVQGMVHSLTSLSGKGYEPLSTILKRLGRGARDELAADMYKATNNLTLSLDQIQKHHAKDVGAKAANLVLMRNALALPTPDGFSITTAAYRLFLTGTGLSAYIDEALAGLAADNPAALEAISLEIRAQIMKNPLPEAIRTAIARAVDNLAGGKSFELRLAVRSSAVGEDGEISFAGQYTSVLNVSTENLADAYKQVVASKYSASALSYRMHHGLDDRETPMAVLVIQMIQPRLSGIVYTADPTGTDCEIISISAVQGLGNTLVGGDVSPQYTYRISKNEFRVLERIENGTEGHSSDITTTDMTFLQKLWEYTLRLENHFQRSLDIEWALDKRENLYLLQVRPLLVISETAEENPELIHEYSNHPVIIEGGKCAAGGLTAGRVLVLKNTETDDPIPVIEPDTILVARTASTSITPWIGKVKGIITDTGGIASHLASVAREFGIPALFDTQTATVTLKDGDEITLWASRTKVYQGIVKELTHGIQPAKRPIFASPTHLRMQRLLDLISPLNLTDPNSTTFSSESCRTVHDIIRFCHEISMREMFRFGETTGRKQNAIRLKMAIPIQLFAMDLGGGLRQGLTTCDEINAHDVVSEPFRALWKGLSHPGINWASTIAIGAHNFMSLMVSGAMPRQNNQLGGPSYAFIADDYLNLNVRFGYHFATVDALCGTDAEQNYVSLQFAGGAGSYFGRSLRIQYMANVLSRLGFETSVKGDRIEASLTRLEKPAIESALDQLGRLLGTSRLLDMAMNTPQQIQTLTESFFQARYDILEPLHGEAPEDFYLITGNWKKSKPDMEPGVLQDGSDFGTWISTGVSQAMVRVMGKRYQEILDNIGAYYYFPLAIAKESKMTNSSAQLMVKPLSGYIDQAGGMAFSIRDWSNYFVFRINALENNAILFEFKNGKRIELSNFDTSIVTGQWYRLRVVIINRYIRAFLEDQLLMEYEADRDLDGYVGLWTKADSTVLFKDLTLDGNLE